MTVLEAAGVPCGPINTLDGVFQDPQVQARGMRGLLQLRPAEVDALQAQGIV